MAEVRKPMSFVEGLAYLFRFDVLSANFRYVLSSFSPALIALGMYAAPVVADLVYKELKKRELVHSSNSGKKFEVTYLDAAGRKHTEEIEDDIAFYQRVRAEGLSVVSIHRIG